MADNQTIIRAAIERLEQQRAVVKFPTPWDHAEGCYDGMWDEEVRLIAALHRTIDPQLAILREVEYQLGPDGHGHAAQEFNLYVPLARAILGEVNQ